MIVDPDFFDHWRTRMVADMLQDQLAPVYIMRLWAHCQNRKGDVFDIPAAGIKALCQFPGSAQDLEDALIAAEYIERNGLTVTVTGWAEKNASLIAAWENGNKGGRPKKNQKQTDGQPTENPSETHGLPMDNPSLTQTKPIREDKRREEETPHIPPAGGRRSRAVEVPKPEDVSEQVWSDWLALRKSKRAAVSATVLAEARSEAAKAGISMERFLTIWCLRGTQGLMAEWLKPSELAQPTAPMRAQDREAADSANPRPQWALDAGFPNVYEARNDGCHERTAHLFRNGKRLEVAA